MVRVAGFGYVWFQVIYLCTAIMRDNISRVALTVPKGTRHSLLAYIFGEGRGFEGDIR